jgi:deazaflavin-dependent oxidoreductase (nitroreductase family)
MPNIRWLLQLITRLHRFLYRTTHGLIGHHGPGYRFLLLANRGRKSGRAYLTPLLYVPDGDRLVVVASNAGDAREPSWWKNLRATPETWVQVGRERVPVYARAASPEEAARLWPAVIDVYASFARYRERAGREIPLVLLERARPGAQTAARR